MLNITTEVVGSESRVERRKAQKISLKQYVLEKLRTWINSLLEAERDEFLGRGRHQRLDLEHDNYRNGYRPRRINFFGLGEIELRVPRDRQGSFESEWLPERKGQIPALEAFLAEVFLAGCSTGDLERISGKYLGQKYDSKQISRIVARATTELEAWRERRLEDQRYKFLYVEGVNFQVRINRRARGQSFCVVLGVIKKDLDSLLTFFQFNATYWTVLRTTNPIERLNKEFNRRTRAMEVTGGGISTYRCLVHVAQTMEYHWSFHPLSQWSSVYTQIPA